MRWFKHMTDSHDDEKLAALLAEHGLEAYGLWWLIVEKVAKQIPKDGARHEVSYPVSSWLRLTGMYHHKRFRIYVQSMHDLRLISAQSPNNLCTISGLSQKDVLTISVPNVLKFRDEYTKKSRQNTDKLPSKIIDTEADTEAETEVKHVAPYCALPMTATEKALRACIEDRGEFLSGKYPGFDLEIELEEMVAKYRDVNIGADPYLIVSRWFKNLQAKAKPVDDFTDFLGGLAAKTNAEGAA
ncbi:hypothetical protein CCP3SC15_2010001 [Gammaproteobacteria bacterium]